MRTYCPYFKTNHNENFNQNPSIDSAIDDNNELGKEKIDCLRIQMCPFYHYNKDIRNLDPRVTCGLMQYNPKNRLLLGKFKYENDRPKQMNLKAIIDNEKHNLKFSFYEFANRQNKSMVQVEINTYNVFTQNKNQQNKDDSVKNNIQIIKNLNVKSQNMTDLIETKNDGQDNIDYQQESLKCIQSQGILNFFTKENDQNLISNSDKN